MVFGKSALLHMPRQLGKFATLFISHEKGHPCGDHLLTHGPGISAPALPTGRSGGRNGNVCKERTKSIIFIEREKNSRNVTYISKTSFKNLILFEVYFKFK